MQKKRWQTRGDSMKVTSGSGMSTKNMMKERMHRLYILPMEILLGFTNDDVVIIIIIIVYFGD
jgi:hypothetical protein